MLVKLPKHATYINGIPLIIPISIFFSSPFSINSKSFNVFLENP